MKKQLFFLTFSLAAFFVQGQPFRNYIPLEERSESIKEQRERSTIDSTDIVCWIGSGSQSATLIPDDVTIAPENIIYWIGEGSNEMLFIVNWCDPEIALAWGYRFDEDSITLSDIMDDIAENDYRFSYILGDWGVDDIRYQDSTLNLLSDGSYFMFLINGGLGQVGHREQWVRHGDYIKWGENSCAHTDADYNRSWTTEITPVTIPSGTGINAFDNAHPILRPNPATDYVQIDHSGNKANSIVSVLDINGRLIYQEVLNNNSMIMSTSELKNGVYFVRITNEGSSKTEKLIITK
ncbi:MAG: T9SS type A sorting domain-containing protein [Bacteroidales bacterium]|jgi:hypothetical protein|nr:T9SS type A sorting domain-containing protein [Bacteroidales bacterium]